MLPVKTSRKKRMILTTTMMTSNLNGISVRTVTEAALRPRWVGADRERLTQLGPEAQTYGDSKERTLSISTLAAPTSSRRHAS